MIFNGTLHIRNYGSRLAPVLVLAALILLLALPFQTQRYAVDENSANLPSLHLDFTMKGIDFSKMPREVQWRQRVVRGERSDGSQLIALYVSTKYEASVALGNALIDIFSGHNTLSADLHFFFFDEENGNAVLPVPQGFVRAALVLQIASLERSTLCVDSYGRDGKQPNRDLVAIALLYANDPSFQVSTICVGEDNAATDSATLLRNFGLALERAVRTSVHPPLWQQLPMATVAFRGLVAPADHTPSGSRAQAQVLAGVSKVVVSTVLSVGSLEEDYHHAAHAWVPLTARLYIAFNAMQFVILLLIAALIAAGYSSFQTSDTTPAAILLSFVVVPLTRAAAQYGGIVGLLVVSVLLVLAYSQCAHSPLALQSLNITFLCLSIGFHPAFGVLAGLGATLQMTALYPWPARRLQLLVGTLATWVVVGYFHLYLEVPMGEVHSFVSLYFTTCIYVNAVFTTSRLLRVLLGKGL